jgi:hypothetical protein
MTSLVEWCIADSTTDTQSVTGTQLISSLVNKHTDSEYLSDQDKHLTNRLLGVKSLIEEFLPNLWQEIAYNPRQMNKLRIRVLKVWVVVSPRTPPCWSDLKPWILTGYPSTCRTEPCQGRRIHREHVQVVGRSATRTRCRQGNRQYSLERRWGFDQTELFCCSGMSLHSKIDSDP